MFSDRTNWKLTRNRLTEALEAARENGQRVLDLTLSNPTRTGLKFSDEEILRALASSQALDYDPQPKGLRSAREAVAGYYAAHGIENFDPEYLVLTTSTSEGYSFVFRLLCNPGDEIMVPHPSYPLFEFLAGLHDVKLVPYPLIYDHGWQIDFHSLEKAANERARAIILVHPNNPTGSYVHDGEREHLNRFCRERELALIVDEVFLDYTLDSEGHSSFVANNDALTFTLSGVSKISALPQMKVAWIAVSGPDKQATEAMTRLEVVADTFLSMSAPIQWATPTLLKQRNAVQPQLLARVRTNLAELDRQLSAQKICQRLHVEGGWYAVLRVPVTQTDEELAIRLVREKSVSIHPGHFYDFPSDGYLILSLITPENDFAQGASRILETIDRG